MISAMLGASSMIVKELTQSGKRRRKEKAKQKNEAMEWQNQANDRMSLLVAQAKSRPRKTEWYSIATPASSCHASPVASVAKDPEFDDINLRIHDASCDESGPCPFLTYGTDYTTFVLAACSRHHATSLTYLSLRVRGLTRLQILSIPYPWLPRAPPLEQSIVGRTVSDGLAGSASMLA